MNTIHVDVVSAEESIFSGEARFVALPGEAGELGILPKHTPLITRIKPGSVRIELADGNEEFVFVAGGILEVQPDRVTVLSDTAVRTASACTSARVRLVSNFRANCEASASSAWAPKEAKAAMAAMDRKRAVLVMMKVL